MTTNEPYGDSAPAPVPPGFFPQPGLPPDFLLPAGVTLAPVGRRIGAYFLSFLLFIVTLGIGWIIWGLFLWPRGQSPAFKVLRLHVVPRTGGTPVGFGRMVLRNVVGGFVQGLLGIISALVSFILFLTGRLHQPLTDLIASTTVVHDPGDLYDGMRRAGQE